jgi:hypothetical protein
MTTHALTQLHECMLDVSRVLRIVQVFGDLLIREMASEPGAPPEQKRHEDDQPGSQKKQQPFARGHAVSCSRRRRVARPDFRRMTWV